MNERPWLGTARPDAPALRIRDAVGMTARDRLIRMARDRGGEGSGDVPLDGDWTMASISEPLEARIARELLRCFLFEVAAFTPWRLVPLGPGARRSAGPGTEGVVGFSCRVLVSGPPPSLSSRRARVGAQPLLPGDALAVSLGLEADLVGADSEPATLIESLALRS